MQFPSKSIIIVFSLLFMNCQPSGSDVHSHNGSELAHDHERAHTETEAASLSFTRWTDSIEMFVEFPPLIVGHVSRFAAHFTSLSDYKPVTEGSLTVSLIVGEKGVRQTVDAPSSPGIFNPGLKPVKPGKGQIIFELSGQGFSEKIILNDMVVHSNTEEAMKGGPGDDGEEDAISFLKEQAWKIEFAIEKVKKRSIHSVIHTSGQILPIMGEEKVISSRSNGIVFYQNKALREGGEIRKGQQLMTISSRGMLDANLEEKFKIAKARLEQARANLARAESLLSNEGISRKVYEQRKMEFEIAEAEFNTLSSTYSKAGQAMTAPISGIIKNIMVNDGQFVSEGTPLIKITNNRRVMLRTEVSQRFASQLEQIQTANIETPSSGKLQSIDDYNGRLVSIGKMLDSNSKFITVLFEMDNKGDLIPGSYAEIYLLTAPVKEVTAIPVSAIMKDYETPYVYVELDGESFEKRDVELGINDGEYVQVLKGLLPGEWVVTQGAYQVKMASMSSSIPAHGHTH